MRPVTRQRNSYADYPLLSFQAYDADMDPSNDLLDVPDDYVTGQTEGEKEEVAIINPEQLEDSDELPNRIRADDRAWQDRCEADTCADSLPDKLLKEIVLPPLAEQPEIIAEAEHTWHIEKWRTLTRREHGPVFEAGGFPW